MEENLESNKEPKNEISDNTISSKFEKIKESTSNKSIDINENNDNSQKKPGIKSEINTPDNTTSKPKKVPTIEKKPFQEFINT